MGSLSHVEDELSLSCLEHSLQAFMLIHVSFFLLGRSPPNSTPSLVGFREYHQLCCAGESDRTGESVPIVDPPI